MLKKHELILKYRNDVIDGRKITKSSASELFNLDNEFLLNLSDSANFITSRILFVVTGTACLLKRGKRNSSSFSDFSLTNAKHLWIEFWAGPSVAESLPFRPLAHLGMLPATDRHHRLAEED